MMRRCFRSRKKELKMPNRSEFETQSEQNSDSSAFLLKFDLVEDLAIAQGI